MKQFSFTNGAYGYVINVNQSRRTFTMIETFYKDIPVRRYKGKSVSLSVRQFEYYLSCFEQLERHLLTFADFHFDMSISCIFPDYI